MSKKARSRKGRKNKSFSRPNPAASAGLNAQIKNLLNKNEYSKAIELLELQSKKTSLTDSQSSDLAFALIEGQGKKAAEQALNCIAKIKQPSFRDLRVKGWCYIYQERWDDAVPLLDELYKKDDDSATLYALCRALLKSRDVCELFGKRYEWSRETDEELRDDETVVKLRILCAEGIRKDTVYTGFFRWLEEVWFYENGERVYEDRRNIKLLERALDMFPADANFRLDLAARFEQINDLAGAENVLSWALTAPNPTGEIFIGAVERFVKLGMPGKALEYFNRADELNLFDGAGKDVLKLKLLFKGDWAEEANSLVEKSNASDAAPEAKFGLLIQKAIYENTGENFAEAVKYLIKAVEIRASDFNSNTPNIKFTYKSSYNSASTHYVLHSEEIDSIFHDSIENLLPHLTELDDDFFEKTINFFSATYELFEPLPEYDPTLQKLLDSVTERELNPQAIWRRIREVNLNNKEYVSGFEAHVEFCLSALKFGTGIVTELDEYSWDYKKNESIPLEDEIDKKTAAALHKNTLKRLKEANAEQQEKIFLPVFESFWSRLLKRHEMYKEIVDTAKLLLSNFPDETEVLWLYAYYSESLGLSFQAATSYRHYLAVQPENPSVLHNLALIVNKLGNLEEAVELSDKAVALAPEDELVCRVNKSLHREVEDSKSMIPKWNALDFYKRKILYVLDKSPRRPSNSYIAKEVSYNVDVRAVGGHLRRLKDSGWIIEDKPNYQLNKFVPKLLSLCDNQFYIGNPASAPVLIGARNGSANPVETIKTSIVRLNDRQAVKPIFNSNGEFHWYQEFTSFFPNYFVIPNTSLQTIFKYDTMKMLLNPDDFHYYLMASVDICVISTQDFLPKFGFELDSHFHDEEKQQIRDERKNRIFITANLPLIRVRRDGVVSREDIRNNIREALNSIPDVFNFSGTQKPTAHQEIANSEDGETVF